MIIGHGRWMTYLDRVMARGRLGHAYLFFGPDEAGLLAAAQGVAKALICRDIKTVAAGITGHGACDACGRIDVGTHPDAVMLSTSHSLTSAKEGRKEIPIDDIRELKRRLSLAAPGDTWRVVIIHSADTMTRDAADAFLKLLEEPGARTVMVLTAPTRFSVPETIRSRAVPLSFPAAPATPIDAKVAVAARAAISGGVLELLVWSSAVAGDAAERTASAHAVMRHVRDRMLAGTAEDRVRDARRLGRMLDIVMALYATNVAPRLALDALFLTAVYDL